jgi:hypothetical protein
LQLWRLYQRAYLPGRAPALYQRMRRCMQGQQLRPCLAFSSSLPIYLQPPHHVGHLIHPPPSSSPLPLLPAPSCTYPSLSYYSPCYISLYAKCSNDMQPSVLLIFISQGTDLHLSSSIDIGPHYAITLREWKEQWVLKKDQVGTLRSCH